MPDFWKGMKILETDKQAFVSVLLLAGVLFALACNQHKSIPADLVVMNARIYTVNSNEPWAQAMAVREGKIIAVGSDKSIAAYQDSSTRIIDAKGHRVLPGFVDAHVHILAGAAQLEQVSLNDAETIGDFQKLIKDYAAAHPEKKWIRGMGWYYNIFGKNGVPHKKYIDEVIPDRPVYLAAYDGHSSLANSSTL